MLKRVRSAGIYVSDQQRALDFFTGKLGCELLSDEPMVPGDDGPRWIEVRLPGDDTRLILFTPPGQEDRIGTPTNLIFHCDDIHATHAELAARGVRFTTEPHVASWGNWWAMFCDVDGNEYGLSLESEDPS